MKNINNKENIQCCHDCKFIGYESPRFDQPYPEIWCIKKHFDGITSFEELLEKNDCKDFIIKN